MLASMTVYSSHVVLFGKGHFLSISFLIRSDHLCAQSDGSQIRNMADKSDTEKQNNVKVCCLYRIGDRTKDPGCEIIYLESTDSVS